MTGFFPNASQTRALIRDEPPHNDECFARKMADYSGLWCLLESPVESRRRQGYGFIVAINDGLNLSILILETQGRPRTQDLGTQTQDPVAKSVHDEVIPDPAFVTRWAFQRIPKANSRIR